MFCPTRCHPPTVGQLSLPRCHHSCWFATLRINPVAFLRLYIYLFCLEPRHWNSPTAPGVDLHLDFFFIFFFFLSPATLRVTRAEPCWTCSGSNQYHNATELQHCFAPAKLQAIHKYISTSCYRGLIVGCRRLRLHTLHPLFKRHFQAFALTAEFES